MYYQIVPMDRSHIEQIARLEQACFSSPWTENMLAGRLELFPMLVILLPSCWKKY